MLVSQGSYFLQFMGIGKHYLGILLLFVLVLGGGFWLLRTQVLAGIVEKQLVSEKPMPLGEDWYLSGVAWEGIGWDGIVDSILSKGFFDLIKLDSQGNEEMLIKVFMGETRVYPSTNTQGVVWHIQGKNVKVEVTGRVSSLSQKNLPSNHQDWESIWVEMEELSLTTGKPVWGKDALNPKVMLMSIWKHLEKEGTLWAGQKMAGKAWIRFPDEKVLFFTMQSIEEDGVTYMATTPEDLKVASSQLRERLTEGELELLSKYPVRLPVLFSLKEFATHTAKLAVKQEPGLSEAAYRHLLWSYSLTREYGPEFAEKVTTAHETGETRNTPEKSAMDLSNNALARQLYKEGIRIQDILEIARKDPRVQRP